jgi:1,4-dihydroxy-2-naphthoate octaprenyltransferase
MLSVLPPAPGQLQLQRHHQLLPWLLILSSIFNAFAYTGGPFPLGPILGDRSIAYSGLGDIFVFLYFGLVATWMVPYLISLQQGSHAVELQFFPSQAIYGVQVGLLCTNILVVNNLRDRHTDVNAGKRTTAVRFGRGFSLIEYACCIATSYALVLVDAGCHHYHQRSHRDQETPQPMGMWRLLPLLSLPLAIREALEVFRKDGAALNQHVGGAAKVQTAFCLLLAVGIILSSP